MQNYKKIYVIVIYVFLTLRRTRKSAQEETRAIIKFCVDLGKTPTETMKMMKDANRSSNVSRSLVFKWHKRFSEGRESLQDDTGRGRKRIVNVGQ